MTVPATTRRMPPQAGDGVNTDFTFNFIVYRDEDVRVVLGDTLTSTEGDLDLNVDYTVTRNGDQNSNPGGTVTILTPPLATDTVTLVGGSPYSQQVALPDGGAYRAENVMQALNLLAIQIQQLKEITDRCAQVPVSFGDAESLFDNINTLSANLVVLQTIVTNINDLITLANNVGDINTLAAIETQIVQVASIAAQVVTVAGIAADVSAVAAIDTEVQTVATNIAAILAAVADLPALAGKANSGPIGASLLTMNTARLLLRTTAGVGPPEEGTVAGTLTLAGGVLTGVVPRGHISGLQMSTAGASTTMTVGAGQAADSTGTALMSQASAINKTTADWVAGSGNGGKLHAAALANNTWYHWFQIHNPSTGAVDVGFDVSPTAPTLPSGYTQFRRIGSGRTNGSGQWLRFFQTGDQFLWDNLGSLDFNGTSTTTAALATLTVPTGVKVQALLNVRDFNANAGDVTLISDPDVSDVAASVSTWPLGIAGAPQNGLSAYAQIRVTTNTSAQIRHRNNRSDGVLQIATIGWIDTRGRFA